MQRAQLKKCVSVLFAEVIGGIIFTQSRTSSHHNELKQLEATQILSLRFYQNSLRDPRNLDLPVTEKKDIESFVAAIRNLTKTRWAIKSLDMVMRIPIRVETRTNAKTLYSVDIHRSRQTGDTGIISINKEDSIFTTPAGVYESEDLLRWAEDMRGRFKDITISY